MAGADETADVVDRNTGSSAAVKGTVVRVAVDDEVNAVTINGVGQA